MLLEGLKVVEMSTWVAAPGCAMIMAEWGADVIKVESTEGDATRRFYPDTPESPGNPIFSMENRGKRGIVLDVGKSEGRTDLIRLLKTADVFVTNLRPGGLKRARIDYESLKDELPRLVYASVTGFGLQGAEADLPAFDLTGFWTRTGVAAATIPPDLEPFTCRPGFGDHVTALATLSGVLAALHERNRTGKGRLVEASLMRAGVYALSWDWSQQLRFGHVVTAQAKKDRATAIGGFFQTADARWICVVPRGMNCFPALMKGLGLEWVLADPRFTPPITDIEGVRELRPHVEAAFARLTLAEARAMLANADVIHAPFATLEEVANDPQARAAGCFVVAPDGYGGDFEAPATPIRFPGRSGRPAGRPGRLIIRARRA
jgi:crotonobetainyl-CoA:carnitine CoA-transferase CaiB-like acyl-CoA transferase